jgi:hypothetical protein
MKKLLLLTLSATLIGFGISQNRPVAEENLRNIGVKKGHQVPSSESFAKNRFFQPIKTPW